MKTLNSSVLHNNLTNHQDLSRQVFKLSAEAESTCYLLVIVQSPSLPELHTLHLIEFVLVLSEYQLGLWDTFAADI